MQFLNQNTRSAGLIAGAMMALLALASGCGKYLSVMPDDRTTLNDTEKLALLLASAYSGTPHYGFTEPMSDNAEDDGNINRFNQINDFAYRWGVNDIDEEEDSPLFYWSGCYRSIAVANQVLASIEELGNQSQFGPAKGEALLIRAYNHFMLVNLWAKHYDPQTAPSDPGIPYVLEPEEEPFKRYSRNTVQEVYDLIERDLLEGLALVRNNYPAPKYRFTPEAAKAFASRFYLYRAHQGDWQQVIDYASEILTSPASQLRDRFGKYEVIGPAASELVYSAPEEPANILIAASPSVYNRTYAGSPGRFTMTPRLIQTILSPQTNPFQLRWAYTNYQYELGGTQFIPKYNEHFVYTNQAAGIGNPYLQHVVLAYDEVFLNRIEAYAMLGDFESARSDIGIYFERKLTGYSRSRTPVTDEAIMNTYRTPADQLTPHYALSEQQRAYVYCVATLRRIEYLHEGMRWFDVRRLEIPVRHVIIPQDTLRLPAGDPKRVMQIPAAAQGSGLAPNQR